MTELFACGTAAVITPIGSLQNDEGSYTVGRGETGETTAALRKNLLDIQYGRAADTHGWLRRDALTPDGATRTCLTQNATPCLTSL